MKPNKFQYVVALFVTFLMSLFNEIVGQNKQETFSTYYKCIFLG